MKNKNAKMPNQNWIYIYICRRMPTYVGYNSKFIYITHIHMHVAYNFKFIDNAVMNFWGL